MKQHAIFLLIVTGFFSNVFSQNNLSEYKYVVVPETYDFLDSKDEYQLNSMTLFLFEKYGFNPYYDSQLPNVTRCEGLYAEIDGKPGFMNRSVVLILKDCNGNEVYRSTEGKSGEKDYRKGFQQALRRAFNGLELLNVNQEQPVLDATTVSENIIEKPVVSEKVSEKSSEKVIKKAATEEVPVQKSNAEVVSAEKVSFKISSAPTHKFSAYRYENHYYLLRKTPEGYAFYKEDTTAENGLTYIGTLIPAASHYKLIEVSGKSFDVMFDSEGNFKIADSSKERIYKTAH